MEIALLKERIDNTEDSDDQRIIADSRLPGNHFRNKRPVRLLPPHILYGERKNETELQKQMNRRRYEQPTNCSDLSLLGYTLNGSTRSNQMNHLPRVAAPTMKPNWKPSIALLNNPKGNSIQLLSKNE